MNAKDLCITKIKPDKSLADPEIRQLFVTQTTETDSCGNQHLHENKEIRFCPYSVFSEKINGVKILFVKGKVIGNGNLIPLPVFLLDISNSQREIITLAGKIKKIKVKKRHFNRPQIACSQEDLLLYD